MYRRVGLQSVAWLMLLALPGYADVPATGDTSRVTIESGPVVGTQSADVVAFKGIPFAQPPVGALRWHAPLPAKPWRTPLMADHAGHDCMQIPFPSDAAPLGTQPSEDCLVLNVWRPSASYAQPLPVLVWIYGGGFVNGGSSPEVYDGGALAHHGLVVVSFNYRLGRFGFFAHPALVEEAAGKAPVGNYGYMDQIAALQWVHRNIGAFGGDPAQVTIMGESAGGGAVHMLLTTPQARGLFRGAIIMSGGGRGVSLMGTRYLDKSLPDTPSALDVGVAFAAMHDIHGSGPQALRALRALPASSVAGDLNLATLHSSEVSKTPTYSGPMVDGTLVTESPDKLYAAGKYQRVALMIGTTSNDIGRSNAQTLDEVYASLPSTQRRFAETLYDRNHTGDVARIAHDVAMDQFMGEPARYVGRLLASHGDPVYLYRFSYVAESLHRQGADHASDIPFFLDTVAAKYKGALTDRDASVAKMISSYVVNFVRNGNPNGNALTPWAALRSTGDQIMDFADTGLAMFGRDRLTLRLDLAATAAAASAPAGHHEQSSERK